MKQRRQGRGETMTEDALILAAIKVAVFVTYRVMDQNIGGIINKINSILTGS
jgi:Flp pilus assembly pilin Flp